MVNRLKSKSIVTLLAIFISVFLLLIYNSLANAYDPNNPDDVYAAKSANSKRQSELESAQEGVSAQLTQTQSKVDDLEHSQIPAAKEALNTANANYQEAKEKAIAIASRLKAAKADKNRIEKQLKDATKQYDSSKIALSSLAREEMRGSQDVIVAQMVFSADNSEQFVKSLETADSAARTQARLLSYSSIEKADAQTKDARLKIVNRLITSLKIQADENEARSKQAQIDAQNYKAKLDRMEADLVANKQKLETQKSQIAQQLAIEKQNQKTIEAQMAEIARKAAAERQKRANGSGGSTQSYQGDGTSGRFGWPVDNTGITAGYGPRPSMGDWHTGIDFGYAHCNDPIYAAADGKVIGAGFPAGWGGAGVVTIDHGFHGGNHWMTRYLHMARFNVSVGQIVKRGQVIAWVNTTGWSTGCHLHYEIWENGHHINPLSQY